MLQAHILLEYHSLLDVHLLTLSLSVAPAYKITGFLKIPSLHHLSW